MQALLAGQVLLEGRAARVVRQLSKHGVVWRKQAIRPAWQVSMFCQGRPPALEAWRRLVKTSHQVCTAVFQLYVVCGL